MRIEIILHVVLNFQFDRACFQRREASAGFDISNNTVSASPTQTQ